MCTYICLCMLLKYRNIYIVYVQKSPQHYTKGGGGECILCKTCFKANLFLLGARANGSDMRDGFPLRQRGAGRRLMSGSPSVKIFVKDLMLLPLSRMRLTNQKLGVETYEL